MNKFELMAEEVIHNILPVKKSKVLVIDDSPVNIKIVAQILHGDDYQVFTALNGPIGIKIAETKFPDLILLDIMMPDMSGFEVCIKLKQNKLTRDIPVIFLTASNQIDDIATGFELGAVDYLLKPFNPTELLIRVKNHIKLKIAYDHLRVLYNSPYHTFISLNSDFEIISFNYTANSREKMFNNRALKIGESVFNYVPIDDHDIFKELFADVATNNYRMLERKYKSETGEDRWYNYIFEAVHNKQKEFEGYLINGTDITEKKEAEFKAKTYFDEITLLHEETQQSLTYASYIQNAILSDHQLINTVCSDHFLIYKPKDKVSGDFYWTQIINNKLIVIAGDCTGHGVPGSLLTAISIMLIERIVVNNEITDPNQILAQLNQQIKATLNQKDVNIRDGLEAAVCVFDKATLTFAGAKRSIFIKQKSEIIEIKGDRKDIGSDYLHDQEFTNHTHQLQKDDIIYVFTDGIVDQIGGEKGKKLLKKRFKEQILSINSNNMQEQQAIFIDFINVWMKSSNLQTDDILLIGIKV